MSHKESLIELYNNQMYGSTEFMKIVLREAIRKLEHNIDPKKVEDWVVKLERAWMKV